MNVAHSRSIATATLLIVVAGVAGTFGSLRRVSVGQQTPAAMPALSSHGREVAGWLDNGLLEIAGEEVHLEMTPDAGLPFDSGANLREDFVATTTLAEQRDRLYAAMSQHLGLSEATSAELRGLFERSEYLSQGNPQSSRHPMSREQCRKLRAAVPPVTGHEQICGAKHMVALYDPKREEPEHTKICIDQYEFPNLPCEYPIVWVRASEALQICRILGKRLCDAHEWEGACAGEIQTPEAAYESFDTRLRSEFFHNQRRRITWATGSKPDGRTCATGNVKSDGCVEPNWAICGSNTYPSGAFPYCVSPFGVYDLHGNVAEHMNLPTNQQQLGARGGRGETEMKGSWFAFDGLHPHPHDCRWRAPAWHATAVDAENSHYNYHLGFRCCRDLD